MQLQVSFVVLVYLAVFASFFVMSAAYIERLHAEQSKWLAYASNSLAQLYNLTIVQVYPSMFSKGR
jgi:hypothetical protein